MKYLHLSTIMTATAISLLLFSCGSKDDAPEFTPRTLTVNGKVEKGPFVSGSTINIHPLDNKLQLTGESFIATIQDDAGNFSLGSKTFSTPYARLAANGYFFNEVTGRLSSGPLTLLAVTDLSDKSTVNVNLLTHIKSNRIAKLVGRGKSFREANSQAQKELLTQFGLQRLTGNDASQYSITAGNEESAALIAISSLIIGTRNEAELTEYMAKLSREFGEEGKFSDDTRLQMQKDLASIVSKLDDIKKNITHRYEELKTPVTIKNLAPYFDWDENGTAGDEVLKEGEQVTVNTGKLEVPEEGGTYHINITSPIPVYLVPDKKKWEYNQKPIDPTSTEELFSTLYGDDISKKVSINLEKELKDKTLTIKVAPLTSNTPQRVSIPIYDYIGNTVATIQLTQTGKRVPIKLSFGKNGKAIIDVYAKNLANTFSEFNTIEQYYHKNKKDQYVIQRLLQGSGTISNLWKNSFDAINNILLIKEADARRLNLFQNYCNVFHALIYYNMVVAWGDMPYLSQRQTDSGSRIVRTGKKTIFTNLETNLKNAIESLKEERNESLNGEKGFFFVPKDVARIILAQIYMYQGDYNSATPLLEKVVKNGYYSLDNSNYSNLETLKAINSYSKENILSLRPQYIRNAEKGFKDYSSYSLPVLNYTDVMLLYAECMVHTGQATLANNYLKQVVDAKHISVSDSGITGIKEARQKLLLYSIGNFAFMKRNKLAITEYGIKDYQQLLPIPFSQIDLNPGMTQNPGY